MKTAALSVLFLTISLCTLAASDSTALVGQPSIFWINGQWQTWNTGAWTPYGHKPAAKSDKSDQERRGNGGHLNQPAPIRRTQRAVTGKSDRLHSARDSEPGPAQGLPIGAPNVAIGKPNVAIGKPTTGIGQPMIGLGQPTIGIGQSTTGIGQTTIGIGQPMKGLGQTTIGIGKLTIGIGQPTSGVGPPTIGIGQPTIGIGKPAIGIGRPEPQKPQPLSRNSRPEISERTKNPQF
jgi:hypothetical protein